MKFIRNISAAELSVCENADNFLQSAMWGKFKSQFGWQAFSFVIEYNGGEQYPLLVLSRRITRGIVMAYVPWPQLPKDYSAKDRSTALAELAVKLKPCITPGTAFIRFEPSWYTACTEYPENLTTCGFKRAAATVQPPDTVHVNLDVTCEELLANMKSKWRYNISLAAKKGVQVKTGGVEDIETFYSLLKETALRDGIAVHNIGYYKTLFGVCDEQGRAGDGSTLRLYIACHEGDTLAANVVLFRGKIATYLYGASSNVKRNLMAPYALQWKAMQDAKEAGCQYYDLFGIPPDDNPNHPMAGLYRFKTGFGGQIIHRPGTWDYIYKPIVYRLFNIAEAMRKKLMSLRKKRSAAARGN